MNQKLMNLYASQIDSLLMHSPDWHRYSAVSQTIITFSLAFQDIRTDKYGIYVVANAQISKPVVERWSIVARIFSYFVSRYMSKWILVRSIRTVPIRYRTIDLEVW